MDLGTVVSSDLGRAVDTARTAGFEPEPDPAWREMDIGRWEGLTRDEVAERFPDELAALQRGEVVRMGGGETWAEFSARVDGAFEALVGRLEDGEQGAVVAHGGVIHSVVSGVLGIRALRRPWRVDRIRNTALTVVEADHRGRRVRVLNDATHTATRPHPDETGPVVTLVRHGESEANVAGRWQGRSDGPLTERGLRQGAELVSRLDGVAHVYASPLLRAKLTAEAFARGAGIPVREHPGLLEIAFGSWEDLTPDEARLTDPALWHRVYDLGEDLPRGGTGESHGAAIRRIEGVIDEMVAAHPEGRVGLFSHGGVIRAYAGMVLGLEHVTRRRLSIPGNAAVSRVRIGVDGATVADYNLGHV
jgi:broad specificity phosphatase PhoE